jgi:hypothetical protein
MGNGLVVHKSTARLALFRIIWKALGSVESQYLSLITLLQTLMDTFPPHYHNIISFECRKYVFKVGHGTNFQKRFHRFCQDKLHALLYCIHLSANARMNARFHCAVNPLVRRPLLPNTGLIILAFGGQRCFN